MIKAIIPYLVSEGKAKEMIQFYQDVFQAEIVSMQTFEDLPAGSEFPIPEEAKGRVLNASIKIGAAEVMISDTMPGQELKHGEQISLALIVDGVEKGREMFEKIAASGQVKMPLQETFWSPLYGQVADQYGILWQLSVEKEA